LTSPALSPNLTLEIIGDFPTLLKLEHEWRQLAETSEFLAPSQSPQWLLPWWNHFGSGELRVFVLRLNGNLAGVVPCFLHLWEGRRQLTLIGSGVSDYLEPPIATDIVPHAMKALGQALEIRDDWDVCNWQDLNSETPLTRILGDGLCITVQGDIECTAIPVTGDFQQYWTERPRGLRRNVKRYLGKAKSIAQPEFLVSLKPEPEIMNALIGLHGARWRRSGSPGMIAENRLVPFLREMASVFADAGALRLFSLRFENRIVSVILSFVFRDTLFSYLSAFDPEYESLGFGRTLLYDSVRYAFEEGYRSWDFLRGNEAYKFDWGAKRIPKRRVLIVRK